MKHNKRILAALLCLCLCLTYLPGTLTAYADTTGVPKIALSETVAEPDKDVVIEVALAENPGLMAMMFTVSYDQALLTLTGLEDGGLTGWERNGDKILWLGDADSSFNGTMLKLDFHVSATAGAGDIPVTLTCNSGDVGNHDEEPFLPTITAGKVHIHGWGTPTYTWSDDNSSVTAQRVCTVDASHIETETVTTTSEVTEQPTCLGAGKTTYTAVFTNPAFATQTKTVPDITPIGHDWNAPSYEWAADNSKVTATRVCKNDASHVETESVDTTSEVTKPATCEGKGETTYTATFTNAAFEVQTKTVANIDATGHAYVLSGWSWTGYTAAKANFTCANDASHTVSVDATITSVRTEPGSEQDGSVVYTAKVTFEGKEYTDSKTEVLPALGHDYELSGWSWTGYTAAAATFTDKNGGASITVDAAINSERTEPTCETEGKVVYTASVTLGGQTYTDTKTETLPALGHDWNAPSYEWAADNSKVTATRVCKNDASHVETETVDTTSEVTKPATCEDKGETTYTATFTNAAFEVQTKTVADVEPTGHDWNAPEYVWAEDNSTVTATRTCKNDASHAETETVNTTSEVTEQPTCLGAGKTTYTAVFTNPAFEAQTKTVADIAPTGHDYVFAGWGWNGYTSAAVSFVCRNDPSHTVTVDAEITSVRTEPTAEENGSVVYTATATFEGKEYTDTKTEILPALGHDYELSAWNWSESLAAASATFTDKISGETITVDAKVTVERVEPTCEAEGLATYTATVSFNGAEYTDTKTETLAALGHDWGEPAYDWAEDYATCTATRVCKNDESHVQTETANTTSEVTKEATADEEGEITYTATFTNAAFKTQTKAVATPKLDEPIVNPFEDVSESDWFYTAVMWATTQKPPVTNGTTPTTFSPTKTCTRAEVVQFLWNAAGQPEVPEVANPFQDVKSTDWFYKSVMWAVANGITSGTDPTHFSPAKKCSRAEVVTFLRNAAGKPDPSSENNPFKDVKSTDWFYISVLWAVGEGITSGTTPTTFAPTKTCTRAEVVQFLYKAAQK